MEPRVLLSGNGLIDPATGTPCRHVRRWLNGVSPPQFRGHVDSPGSQQPGVIISPTTVTIIGNVCSGGRADFVVSRHEPIEIDVIENGTTIGEVSGM